MTRPSRLFLLSLPLFFVACATPEDAREAERLRWRAVQRERLATLLPGARPGATNPIRLPAARTAMASRPMAQEPAPLRPFGPERGSGARIVELRGGGGTWDLRLPGTRLSDRTEVATAEVRLLPPTPSGAGMTFGGFVTDDDLFAGTVISNGAEPVRAAARAFGFDVFSHWQTDLGRSEAFAAPLRAGLFVDWKRVDHTAGEVERSWFGFGPRLQFEPEWWLVHDRDLTLSLVGLVGGEAGGSWFRDDFINSDDSELTARWGGEAGGGLRLRLGRVTGELGYRFGYRDLGELDSALLGEVGKVEERMHVLFLGLGTRF
ncbi:MAG: hypothetical protein IPK26_06820 [Planctomycetes bacterium]|nr:hypothetical protein [Planctomycetota bacterium]